MGEGGGGEGQLALGEDFTDYLLASTFIRILQYYCIL